MERNLISINLPNLITIPLMAAIGFLAAGLVWQIFKNVSGGAGLAPAGSASVATAADDGGY
jgi:hypothetical protein